MIWLFFAVGAALVAMIALVAVGSAVRRLEDSALPVVLEVDDAVDWIAERLPVESAGQLSREDVVSVVGWYLEVFDEAGLSTEQGEELGDAALGKADLDEVGSEERGNAPGQWVALLDGALEHVVARGLEQADPLDAVSVAMVAELLGTYLREMGAFSLAALGGADAPGEAPDPAEPRG
ncbi:MAG: hypothetical protein VYD46_01580 [Actinomycetota bacterium]|nr:hypothetical protein [Actinomycetota bacterium]